MAFKGGFHLQRQVYEYHPVIGFRFIPDLKVRIPHEGGGYRVRTNDTGFRSDRPFCKDKTASGRRILLFGDSFTAGEGVSNGQRYGDFLEKIIHRRLSQKLSVFCFCILPTIHVALPW